MQAYSDLNSRVIKDYNKERHFHPELEVLYIVTGETDVTIEDMIITRKGIFIRNWKCSI